MVLALLTFFFLAVFSEPIVSPPVPNGNSVEFPNAQTAADWYEWAQVEIKEGKLDEARTSLARAIALDPEFLPAQIQLGFVELWQNHQQEAYRYFSEVLIASPCETKTLQGLYAIGVVWTYQEDKQKETLNIFETLNACDPNNPDTLFYLGKHLARDKQWDEAERVLQECLALVPEYGDAEVQLAYIYLWKARLDEAEEIFARYPDNADAQQGLARVYRNKGEEKRAQSLYRKILAKNSKNTEARTELARSLAADMNFYEADIEYSGLVGDDPNTEQHWIEWFDVRSHTRPAVYLEAFYTDAKENDPTLRVPVVKNYYLLEGAHFLIPIFNRWRLDLKQIYYHQRENDIFPPVGVNYTVFFAGGQVTSSYFFMKDWKWDVVARSFQAWGNNQNVEYPFQKTVRFEPGTSLLYNSERQLFVFDAHVESLIIKNFAVVQSQLLRTDYLTLAYGYKIPVTLHPEVEAWVTHIFFHDNIHNWENTEIAIARCGVPYISKYFTALYRFEHNHFDKLTPNYYSFKQQLRNVLGVKFHYDFYSRAYLEAIYEHRWETTYSLIQPIGNFLFVAAKQYLAANRITSKLGYRFKDTFRFEIEGHYFHTTLIYRDWNLNGSLLWQF